jgi:hypothetical protein
MPICTPQLCFGDTAPNHNAQENYNSYTFPYPRTIDVGNVLVKNGFVIWGENKPDPNNAIKFRMQDTFVETRYVRSTFQDKTPTYKFTAFSDNEILDQINEKLGVDANEIDSSIKEEIIKRIKNFSTPTRVLESMFKSNRFTGSNVWNFKDNIFDPTGLNDAILVYKAIMGGQTKFPYLLRPRVYRTQYYWFDITYKVTILISSIDFCKKVEDQFPLDLTDVTLDPTWQKELVQDDPKLNLCDCLQISLDTKNIFFTQIADDYFINPESVLEYANNSVRDRGFQNLAPSSFSSVNSTNALGLFQAMANQGRNGQMMYGYLGNVIGFATRVISNDGPQLICGWIIPLTSSMEGQQVLGAESRPSFTISLNTAGQLQSNPYNNFETMKNNLIAVGFGGTIPGYDQIDQDLQNKAVQNQEDTQTNIDLDDITLANSSSQETGANTAKIGSDSGLMIINMNPTLEYFNQRGKRVSGY